MSDSQSHSPALSREAPTDAWVPEVPWLGIVVADLASSRICRANRAFLELIGYDATDLESPGLSLMDITPDDSERLTRDALAQLRESGSMQPIVKTYRRKDGQLRKVWVTGMRFPGDPRCSIGYVLDVTEQQNTLTALRESEQRASRLAEASFEGLFLHENGVIVDANDVLLRMFGVERERLIGNSALEFADPASHELLLKNVARQHEQPYEVIGRKADGTTFPIEVLGKPLYRDGRAIRVTAVRDLTERKRTEAALREAETALRESQRLESLGLLAGGIAHDFNNLLAVIVGYTSLALKKMPDEQAVRSALVEIEQAATRAADLTRQILVYSGRSPKTVGEVDLNRTAREMTHPVGASFAKKIQLQLELEGQLPPVLADGAQMQQVVLNLLTNAAEAIGEHKGVITLRTAVVQIHGGEVASPTPGEFLPAGKYVVLEIADTGTGMDETTAQRIFDPFFSTKGAGRGLGLSTMLGILRGHAGGLALRTEVGRGSTFRVYLPAHAAADKARASRPLDASAHVSQAERQRTVLLVDDEDALRRAMKELLESDGCVVLEASNGRDAVDIYREKHEELDLVVLDLVMPELDGHEALERLREIDPEVPVILMSGFDAHEVLGRSDGKVAAVLAKPFLGAELVRVVETVLDSDA